MVDYNKIKDIAKLESGRAIMQALSKRERNRNNIAFKQVVRVLREGGSTIDKQSIAQVFKDLQQAGVGRIVYGRQGNPNRFMWDVPLKEVAAIAIGDTIPTSSKASGSLVGAITVTNGRLSIQIPLEASENVIATAINSFKRAI